MTTARPAIRTLSGLLVAGVLASGCSGGKEPDRGPSAVFAADVCSEGLLNQDAVHALALLTGGATAFKPPKNVGDVAWVAGVLERGYAKNGGSLGGVVCRATPVDIKNRHDLSVHFEIESELQRTGEQSESGKAYYWEYDLGRNALVLPDSGRLYFDCASARLAGSDKAVPIMAAVSLGEAPTDVDPRALREANLTIVHSAARALAKELGCKDGGGLPERLVVKEKAAPTR
ncbi:hypothetical protein ABZ934_21245 [Streptomyces sp. NPDC046557]|uniref:hypothetical protein n=1 Tax=Streptomyces sp. NPDC046557 TaxID=3155372 RepID=UPI0033DC8AC9